MSKKAVKKVDVKKVEKDKVMEIVRAALVAAGYGVDDGADFGFTAGTVVVKGAKCDVQIKPITPKAGVDRYEALVDEDEEEEVIEDSKDETPGAITEGTEQ